jgi:ABC-type cobalt transport system substrate-binding protein
MDRFTKYALLVMVMAVALMLLSTYLGVYLFGGTMETKYVKVIEDEAERLGVKYSHLIELRGEGEYVAFSIAGAVSGFIIGYLIPSIFGTRRGEADG